MSFDADKFMEQSTTEQGSTSFEPIPAGEYPAIIDDVKVRNVTTKNGPGHAMDVFFLLQNSEVAAKLGREKLTVKWGFFLDITENGGFDMSKGKNVKLNQLREALGQNKAGQAWKPSMLKGAGPLKVQVTLRPDKASDAIYNDIRSVGKM